MALFKSIINGVGTGAGVAWPLFGIVSSVAGTSIGGLLSFTLGGIAITLFLTTCAAVFYLSYQQSQEEQQKLQMLLKKNEQKLMEFINEYIKTIDKKYQLTDKTMSFESYLLLQLNQQLLDRDNDKQSPLHQSLIIIKIMIERQLFKEKSILSLIEKEFVNPSSVPFSKAGTPMFFAFVGTFGSIAGCSAGLSGLFSGLGLFSSFAAFPLLGWGVLAMATSMGIFAANNAFIESQENYKNEVLNQTIKTMYQHLKNQVYLWAANVNSNIPNFLTNRPPRNFPALFLNEQKPGVTSYVAQSVSSMADELIVSSKS
ncbi:hypothetical protein [Legionella rowbothamii]|uniref:hypothetical protein n=1 Tax=Legionella rowbothamii TaxID=96229 RepID=UPI0010558AAE|nr:hypothetical protein [Legionella rowbothamii]